MYDFDKNGIDVFIVIDDDTCPLCLELVDNKQRLICDHNICSSCMNHWRETQRGCPLCKDFSDKAIVVWIEPNEPSTNHIPDDLYDSMFPTSGILSSELHVYAVNYNVLRIMSGLGGLSYSN